jgi:hypothetical protein
MRALKIAVAAALPALAPALAHADDMSYRYFEAGYMETDVDGTGTSDDLDGFATRGSFGFAKNFFVFTEYQDQSLDTSIGDISLDQFVIGLGGHAPISSNVDFVGRVGYVDLSLDVDDGEGGFDADESGYLLGAGIRARLGERVEAEIGAVYYDLGSGDPYDNVGGEAELRFNINDRWAAGIEYQDLGDVSTLMLGVRVNFGVK